MIKHLFPFCSSFLFLHLLLPVLSLSHVLTVCLIFPFPHVFSSLLPPSVLLSFPIATYHPLPLLSFPFPALLLDLNPPLTLIFSVSCPAEWRQQATSECCRWTWRWTGWWWFRGDGKWRGRWSIRSPAPWPARFQPSSAWHRRTSEASCPSLWWGSLQLTDVCALEVLKLFILVWIHVG